MKSSKHPGTLLKQNFMVPLGLTTARVAGDIGVDRSTLTRLVGGQSRLTPQMAAKLAAYFKTPIQWWLDMQLEYDLAAVADTDPDINRHAPLDGVLLGPLGLIDIGPIPAYSKPEQVVLTREELLSPANATESREAMVLTHSDGSIELTGR